MTREEFEKEVLRRARLILGFRGVRGFETVQLNVTSLRSAKLVDEDSIVEAAREIADDTQAYM